MNTNFALLARFESPTVELKQISQEFLASLLKQQNNELKLVIFLFRPSSYANLSEALR